MHIGISLSTQDFPLRVDLWEGDNLGKMGKNCKKITKSTPLRQNSGSHGGREANALGGWGNPPSPLRKHQGKLWYQISAET